MFVSLSGNLLCNYRVMAERKTKKLKSQKDVKDLLESANGEQHPTVLGYFERFGSQGMREVKLG